MRWLFDYFYFYTQCLVQKYMKGFFFLKELLKENYLENTVN